MKRDFRQRCAHDERDRAKFFAFRAITSIPVFYLSTAVNASRAITAMTIFGARANVLSAFRSDGRRGIARVVKLGDDSGPYVYNGRNSRARAGHESA